MNEPERLKAELERVQKQAAAMRKALVRLCNSWAAGTERENYEAMKEAKAAISSDAGRDFIRREQVKPLILRQDDIELALRANNRGSLEFKKEFCECDPEVGNCPCQYCAVDSVLRKALWATEHARKLGL